MAFLRVLQAEVLKIKRTLNYVAGKGIADEATRAGWIKTGRERVVDNLHLAVSRARLAEVAAAFERRGNRVLSQPRVP